MTYDLEYRINGMFTQFIPNTKAGECAFNAIAAHTDGTGNIFTAHLDSTLKQLRAAGYSVCRARKVSLVDDDALLAELMA